MIIFTARDSYNYLNWKRWFHTDRICKLLYFCVDVYRRFFLSRVI